MGRKSKKRRFYPEFYSDEEYRAMIKRRSAANRSDAIQPAETDAEGADDVRKTSYSEQELTDIYSRLKGTEAGNEDLNVPRQLDIGLENFKNEFIEESKKFSPLSPENPLKGIEIYTDGENSENDTATLLPTERSALESEPENGGYIQYDGGQNDTNSPFTRESAQETFNASVNEIINEEDYETSTMEDIMTFNNNGAANEPDGIAVFNDNYIDPDELSETEDLEELDTMDTFSDHYIAPGETIEDETYENFMDQEDYVETMEAVQSPPVSFAPAPIAKEENTAQTEANQPNSISNSNPPYAGLKPYDREAAVKYAHRWALDRNAEYYDYDEIGGDCTNYASQVLFAGGCAMDFTPNTGWYYKSGNLKSPSWTGVEQLYNFLVGEKIAGPIGREVDISETEPGDLVNLSFNGKTYQHCPVIVKVKRTAGAKVSPKDIFICAHSYDCESRPLDTYTWKKMRFIKIVGTK